MIEVKDKIYHYYDFATEEEVDVKYEEIFPNENESTPDDYVCELIIDGIHHFNVFSDDYGQCYYFIYEEGGINVSFSCGTYNWDYVGMAIWIVRNRK